MTSLINESDTSLSCLYFDDDPKHIICNETAYHSPEEHLTPSSSIFWVYLIAYIILVLVCTVMQGLSLVVASCDLTTLKVMSEGGTERTRKYARRMIPFAERLHLTLVALIVANATAATTMPIFFERLTSPITAIAVSTTAVLIFGEILPQAVCGRYGLPLGYYMSWMVWIVTGLFFVISYPMSLLLGWMLGKESGTMYRRNELCALVEMHGPVSPAAEESNIGCAPRKMVDLDLERLGADEVLVIKGALTMAQKTATEVMVKLEDVYMLPSDAILDEVLADEIFNVGHSRIPVYEGERTNVIGVLLTKRLIMVDKSQRLPIRSVFSGADTERSLYPPYLADETTPLYDLLNQFQTGTRTHMAFITTTELTEKDFLILGIVTLEDLIEELLQEEIRDESDLQRHWRFKVAKDKLALRLTTRLNKGHKDQMVESLSAPSLVRLNYNTTKEHIERDYSMPYIS